MSIRKRTINLADVLNSAWLMPHQYAQGYFPKVVAMIEGAETEADDNDIMWAQPYVLSAPNSTSINVYYVSEFGEEAPPEKAPKNSVAVISLNGVMTKYDQWCGGAGTETKADQLQRCLSNPNIIAVVFDVDSGGGQAAEKLNSVARNAQKPVLASVNGYCCSAAQWFTSNTRETFVSGKMSVMGSIGAFVEIADFSKYYEQKGINVTRTYAPQSTEKNKSYEDLLKGDPKAMRDELEQFVDIFISEVQENRPNLKDDKKVFKGKTYLSEDAVAVGLADKIGDLNDAIIRAYELANVDPNSINNSKIQNTMFEKISALKGVKADALTPEMIEIANAELVMEGINTVAIVSKADQAKAVADAQTAALANADLQKQVETLTAKVTALEKADGADPVSGKKETDVITEDPAVSAKKKMDALPHNKIADEAIL